MKKAFLFVIWLLFSILVIDASFGFISAPSDVKVGVGVGALLLYTWITAETRFFTDFTGEERKKYKKLY